MADDWLASGGGDYQASGFTGFNDRTPEMILADFHFGDRLTEPLSAERVDECVIPGPSPQVPADQNVMPVIEAPGDGKEEKGIAQPSSRGPASPNETPLNSNGNANPKKQ